MATVLELFSRRLLGYAMSAHHDADLTCASLSMAAAARGGRIRGVIFHNDRGSEYTATEYDTICMKLGVIQSMGRVGSALDNAAAEAVNSILKTEFVYRRVFADRTHARTEIGRWIDYSTTTNAATAGATAPAPSGSRTNTRSTLLRINRPQHDGPDYTFRGD